MTHELSKKLIITAVLGVLVCIFCVGGDAFAQISGFVGSSDPRDYTNNRNNQGNYGVQGNRGRTAQQDRQQKAQQDIQDSARILDDTLVDFLQMINANLKPTPQQVDAAKQAVVKAKKYNKHLTPDLKCEAFVLQAWSEYFGGDVQKAYLASKSGYQAGRTNNDARATHTAMSLVMDRKPIVVSPPRQRSTTRSNTRNSRGRSGGNPTYPASTGYPGNPGMGMQAGGNMRATAGNILELDIEAVDMDMIGQTVRPMKLNCINSTSFDYSPSQSSLCILFWQAASKNTSGEPNGFTPGNSRPRAPRPGTTTGYNPGGYGRGDAGGGYGRGDAGGYGRGDAGGGAGRYDRNEYGRGDYDDRSYDRRTPAGGGYPPPGGRAYQPAAAGYGMPAQQRSDPFTLQIDAYSIMFGSQMTNPQVKFLAINTDSAESYLPAVSRLLKSPMPWANVMASNPTSGAAQYADMNCKTPKLVIVGKGGKIRYAGPATGFLAPMMLDHVAGQTGTVSPVATSANTTNTGGVSNALKSLFSGRSGSTAVRQPSTSQGTGDSGEITPESYQAGKLFEHAKMYVAIGRKPKLTSKTGVDICREIIAKYPNTKEAREARILLRSVPERERKRYKITDEEMGL